jgi:hypothetical protein
MQKPIGGLSAKRSSTENEGQAPYYRRKRPIACRKHEPICRLIANQCRKRGGGSTPDRTAKHRRKQNNQKLQKPDTNTKNKKTKNAGCWVVGLGDNLEGEKGERAKIRFLQTFPPNPVFSFLRFSLLSTRL